MVSVEYRDISQIPMSEVRIGVSRIAKSLFNRGCLPNGLSLLLTGSHHRRDVLFYESGANQGLEPGKDGFNELWQKWVENYDEHSGVNLAATALYQHERYDQENEKFPKPNSPEYVNLEYRMGWLGRYTKEIERREGWGGLGSALYEIGQEIVK